MEITKIGTPHIKLDQFLKFENICGSGGEAKDIIAKGEVRVNGTKETRRGRKLKNGDKVSIKDDVYVIRQDGEGDGNKKTSSKKF